MPWQSQLFFRARSDDHAIEIKSFSTLIFRLLDSTLVHLGQKKCIGVRRNLQTTRFLWSVVEHARGARRPRNAGTSSSFEVPACRRLVPPRRRFLRGSRCRCGVPPTRRTRTSPSRASFTAPSSITTHGRSGRESMS